MKSITQTINESFDKSYVDILKKLKPKQCVELATLLYPDVDWKYTKSENKWDGHDIVDNISKPQYVFQIDYRAKNISFDDRFIYFDQYIVRLDEDQINKIKEYLDKL